MPTPSDPAEINVLVVDDEEDVVEVVSHFLEEESYNVQKAYDGHEALDKANADLDIIVLDIMLPGPDGYEVCEKLRSRVETETIPIIFLSAKTEDEDQVKGLMIGADDYLTKPVSPQVIVAHVKAVLRRSGVAESNIQEVKGLTIYEDEYRAERKAFTRQQLLETIWKDAMMVTERTVDAHIKNLREKLNDFAQHIQTVRGVGYRFVEEPEPEEERQ
ncbi:MAG: DNA-binding response regulator [Bacteroidetes bacterium QS_8_64_10]|nr:MAG: DNA-binding response regulator [Bacteroidetes bacterium QS_8_64_10]